MVPINQINIQFYKTKVAEFILGSFDGKLCLLDFRYRRMRGTIDKRLQKGLGAEFVERDMIFCRWLELRSMNSFSVADKSLTCHYYW